MITHQTLLTRDQVQAALHISRASLYRFMGEMDFPKPIKFGRASRWIADEVDEWLKRRPRAELMEMAPPDKKGEAL